MCTQIVALGLAAPNIGENHGTVLTGILGDLADRGQQSLAQDGDAGLLVQG